MMNKELLEDLVKIRDKLYKKDYAMLRLFPDDLRMDYALYAKHPLPFKDIDLGEVSREGYLVYFGEDMKEAIIRKAKDDRVEKVMVTGVHLEEYYLATT
jgi:hypothetical protein